MTTEPTETVKLKNGAEEAKPLVVAVLLNLNSLWDNGKGIMVFELAQLCRDPSHIPFGVAKEELKDRGLAKPPSSPGENWHVDASIKNIVLSAVTGEGLDMSIGNPVAD